MSNKVLLGVVLACLLVPGVACGHREQEVNPVGNPPSSVQTDDTAVNPGAGDNGRDAEKQDEIVIKTDNRGSGENADKMLQEVDRELDALIRAMDALDAVDTGELEEG